MIAGIFDTWREFRDAMLIALAIAVPGYILLALLMVLA